MSSLPLGIIALGSLSLLAMGCGRPEACVTYEERCSEPVIDDIAAAVAAHRMEPGFPEGLQDVASDCGRASSQDDESSCLTLSLSLSGRVNAFREWQSAQ